MNTETEKSTDLMLSDTIVLQRVTWERLQGVIEHCRMLQDSLEQED